MLITIPFKPRDYQIPLIDAIDSGKYKRAIALWHRRAGKDIALWNLIIKKALLEKGLYYYFLPTYTQAKKIIWDGINNNGFRFLDYIPKEALEAKNGTELKITLKNGSIVQLIGTDTYNAIRGTNPRGCVFSESAFQNPMAWEVIKPILKVNGGWAVFNSTSNGKNHFYEMFNMAENNDKWFTEKLTIEDTGVLTQEDMNEERDEGMDEDMIQQEYFCSFDVGARGSYYSSFIRDAEKENRVCDLPYEKHIPVDIFQDIGRNDAYSMGFLQRVGEDIRFIDSYEDNGKEVAHYIEYVLSMKYRVGIVYLPHDARQKRIEAKNSVWEQWEEAGFRCKLVPKHSIVSGIAEVRKKFKRFKFDKKRCKLLLSALDNYHKEWDEVNKVFRNNPKHNWASNFADMVRYVAIGWSKPKSTESYEESAKDYAGSEGEIIPTELGVKEENMAEYEQQLRKYL